VRRGLRPLLTGRRRALTLHILDHVVVAFVVKGTTQGLLLRVVAKSPDDLYRVAEVIRLCPGILRTSTSLFLREVIPYRVSELLKGSD